jgi:hypothetical protein
VNAADTVIDAVRRVEFGPLTTFRNLGLLALSTAGEREADYLTLDEASHQAVEGKHDLLDELRIHLVPLLLGAGTPLLKRALAA